MKKLIRFNSKNISKSNDYINLKMENFARILSPYNRSEKIPAQGKNLDDMEVKENTGVPMPPCENIDFDWD